MLELIDPLSSRLKKEIN